MCMFRDLTKDDIEVRVQSASEKGVVLLLYKNARVDMSVLDETVGQERWQREHYECKGNLFCRVGIRFGDEWVYKSDCGSESNTEAEKGEASDSFKRACFNWGIGRELYTAPFIWVSADKCNISQKQTQKGISYSCYDSFSVSDITVTDKKITALSIYNDKKHCAAFTFGALKAQNVPDGIPFPEAYSPAVPLPAPPSPASLMCRVKTREDAQAYTLDFGDYKGKRLTEVYKLNKQYFISLRDNPPNPDVAAATSLIWQWIAEANRGAAG